MPRVTIYTLPNCVQCNQIKKLIDREGIAYDPVKLEEHPDIAADSKEQGLLQAPSWWSGTTAGARRASSLTRS